MGILKTPSPGPVPGKHPMLDTARPATMTAITAVIFLVNIANPFVVYAFLRVHIVISCAELSDFSDDSRNSKSADTGAVVAFDSKMAS